MHIILVIRVEYYKNAMFCRFSFVPDVFSRLFDQKKRTQNRSTFLGKQQRPRTVKVVDSLNPYIASANVRLVLDLIAARAGVGLALRCLSFLELDVQNNWKPFKPVLQFIRYNV